MKLLDLFSGIGGFSLAADSLGIETVAFCEIEPYAVRILNRHWPDVPVFPDVKELTADALADTERSGVSGQRASVGCEVPTVGAIGTEKGRTKESSSGSTTRLILTAGFPCQDISYAGKGAGLAGERSGLFYEVARLVDELRPDYVLLENVSALLTRGLDAVLGTLASLGYDALWACVPACAVGAPHRRDRVWIVGVPTSDDSERRLRANYERVLSGLTPFGDETWVTPNAMDSLKPREWGSDAYERMLRRGDPDGVRREGSGNLREQVTEPKAWPTPQAFDHIEVVRRPDERSDAANAGGCSNLRESVHWPTPAGDDANNVTRESGSFQSLTRVAVSPRATPNASTYKGSGPLGSDSQESRLERCYIDAQVQNAEQRSGSLNPAWVETLLGYPIGYTLPDGDPMRWLPTRWPAGLGAPQHEWEPPRLTTVKENRAARLKALGNSIVPQVARLWLEAIQEVAR